MAACYIRQARWEKAIYAASKTLSIAPKNLKALYRRAQSYLELGRTELAAKDIDLALDHKPNGKSDPPPLPPWQQNHSLTRTSTIDPVIRQLGERLVQAYEREEQTRITDNTTQQ